MVCYDASSSCRFAKVSHEFTGVVTSLTTTAPFDDTSGILGLGWDANAETSTLLVLSNLEPTFIFFLFPTETIPFVESLAANNKLNEPLMAFYLTRLAFRPHLGSHHNSTPPVYSHTNDKNAGKEEPGGQFNIVSHTALSAAQVPLPTSKQGYLNETLYDGDIEYWGKQDIPEWTIPLVSACFRNVFRGSETRTDAMHL